MEGIEPGGRKEMLLGGILRGDTETNIEPGDREEALLAGILRGDTETNIEPGSRKEALLKAILENGGGGGGGGGKITESWHQCPEAVRNYLANVTYDPSDYSTSQIANYAPATPVTANTKPIGKTIDGVTFYNEVPNEETPFSTTNKAGTLEPLDQVRWINTSTPNVRDMGGWTCDGGTIKYGMLIRGGNPELADRSIFLDTLGIKYELDLRGESEAAQNPSVLKDYIGYSVFDDYAWYTLTKTALWRKMLRVVFDCVLTSRPVYFHCAAGADRTGTLACIIEGILGVSQSDIDKDYELTSFYSGTGTDQQARRRNETEWSGLISQIVALSGSTFRDKCVQFVASLGFTADEINDFRSAMTDGTPETVSPSISTYTITKTLTNSSLSNTAVSATEYQPYETEVKPNSGYAISGISVTMGGVDITGEAFSGTLTELKRKVTYNLTGCVASIRKSAVFDGEMYYDEFTAQEGYTLEGATVTILMGGVDVSSYYSDGKIQIPSVTGNLAITVTAVESAKTNLLTMNDGNINKRLGSSGLSSADGYFVTDFFEVDLVSNPGLEIIGAVPNISSLGSTAAYENCKIALYDSSKTLQCQWYVSRRKSSGECGFTASGNDISCSNIINNAGTPQSGSVPSASAVKYIRVGLAINNAAAAISNVSDVLNSGIAIYAE